MGGGLGLCMCLPACIFETVRNEARSGSTLRDGQGWRHASHNEIGQAHTVVDDDLSVRGQL